MHVFPALGEHLTSKLQPERSELVSALRHADLDSAEHATTTARQGSLPRGMGTRRLLVKEQAGTAALDRDV